MESLLNAVLMNAACATLLAGVVAVTARWIRRPAVVHLLWVIVLVKLLSPPLVQLDVVPRPTALSVPAATTAVLATLPPAGATLDPIAPAALVESPDDRRVAAGPSWGRLLTLALGLWLAGAIALASLTLVRGRRFARFVTEAGRRSRSLETRVSELAERMGISRCPSVRVVPGRVSPMLRPRWGGVELLFPSGLLARLNASERDTLLAHELAHVRRRDHWIRYVELAALCAFWWLPVAWWARTRLRRAEEQCCDAWVIDTLPRSSRAYGRALVKTLEFLAGAARPVPALASGVGEVRHLEERLIMILKRSATPWLSRSSRVLLAISALAVVLVFPSWAELPAGDDDAERVTAEQRELESRYRDRVLLLEREMAGLEAELREVHARRMDVELEWREIHGREELDRIRDDASRLRESGQVEESRELLEQAELFERQFALEAERARLDRDLVRQANELERPLELLAFEMEQLRAQGDHEAARRLDLQALEIQERLEKTVAEARARDRRLDGATLQSEIDHLRIAAARMHDEGRNHEAAEIERRIEMMITKMDAVASVGREGETDRIQREIEMLLRELQERGADEEAVAVREFMEQMLRSVDEDEGLLR